MKKHRPYFTIVCMLLLIVSCKSSIKPADLYGKWKYTKVEHPKADPPDSLTKSELQASAPYIQFSDKDLVIMWGGKILSHGTYLIDGDNIRYTEFLPEEGKRQFPFWISKFDGINLVFETTGAEGSRVTAVKE
jgi:hypothetical protein